MHATLTAAGVAVDPSSGTSARGGNPVGLARSSGQCASRSLRSAQIS